MKTVVFCRMSDIYNDSRAIKEITALLKNGYFVMILGWNKNGNSSDKIKESLASFSNYSIHLFNQKRSDSTFVKKIMNRYNWSKWAANIIKKGNSIDIIHLCDFDCAEKIHKIALRKNIKYIYDIYDYYADSHNFCKMIDGIIRKKENRIINRSSATLICTEERRLQIIGTKPSRLVVLHNSPDITEIDLENGKFVNEPKYDYSYCGALSGDRLIGEILENYNKYCDFKMAFAGGEGTYSEKIKALAKTFQNVKYFGPILYKKVLEIENDSICLSAIYNPAIKNHKFCAPNKFYEALALGKPIIVCRGTGIDAIVEKYKIGSVIDYNPEQFYKALEFYKKNPDVCKKISVVSKKLYFEKYTWSVMENRLLSTYREILGD